MGTGSLADGLIFTLTIYISRFKGSNKKSLSCVLFYSKLPNGLLHCSYKKSWRQKHGLGRDMPPLVRKCFVCEV